MGFASVFDLEADGRNSGLGGHLPRQLLPGQAPSPPNTCAAAVPTPDFHLEEV